MARQHDSTVRRRFVVAALLASLSLLGACGSAGTHRVATDANAGWAVLMVENLSSTPLAGRQAAALLETRLRQRGAASVEILQPRPALALAALLESRDDVSATRAQAIRSGHRYALSGTVHEWHYKSAPDLEPVVGLSLKLEDLAEGRVIWQSTGSRTGWGRASLSATAERVVAELLEDLAIPAAATR